MKGMSLNFKNLSFLKILFIIIIVTISGCNKITDLFKGDRPDFEWSDAQFTTNPPSSLTPNLISNIQQSAPPQAYSDINLKLMQIDSYWSQSSAMLSALQYMPGMQEENGNSMRISSPAPPTWTWVSGPFTIIYTYNNTGSQYVYSYTVDYNGCLYYDINGWENINGSAGHYEYNIDLSCMGGTTPPYNMTVDWQHSSGVYDLQVSYDPMGIIDPIHFDEQINTNDGSGYFYWYSNPNSVSIACPLPPNPLPNYSANQTHSPILSLEYECHWTNYGSNGDFWDYTVTPPQSFSW